MMVMIKLNQLLIIFLSFVNVSRHKFMARNHIFIFSTFSLKQPAGGASYYARRLAIIGYHSLLKL